jgi:hypothetical protein
MIDFTINVNSLLVSGKIDWRLMLILCKLLEGTDGEIIFVRIFMELFAMRRLNKGDHY